MTRQIERLVESSYRDLAPSDHVEAELLRELPPQRKRTNLSVPIGIAAVILIAITAALFGKPDVGRVAAEGKNDLALATVARPRTGVVARAATDVPVRLGYEGRIEVMRNKQWTTVSLDGLGSHLEEGPRDQRIVISVDRNAPWQHLQWIMLICAEQYLPSLAFEVASEKGETYLLDASLPTDGGLNAPVRRARVRARVEPKQDKNMRWRGSSILMPSAAAYWIDTEMVTDQQKLVERLQAERRLEPARHGEIMAPAGTPFWMVAQGIGAVRSAGFERLDFYGTAIPPKEVRAATALPYPRKLRKGGPVLKFTLVDGDPKDLPRTVELLRERARVSESLSTGELIYTDTGIEWTLGANEDAKLAQQLVERQGVSLEFHITVEKDNADFEREWKRRQGGKHPSEGFQWYELGEFAKTKYAKSRLPDDTNALVLCRTDDYRITKASLREVAAERITHVYQEWAVSFAIREEHQENMAKLTQKSGEFLAIILDGRVHSAPNLRERLRTRAQITGGFSERDARALAALLRSPALPVRLKLKQR